MIPENKKEKLSPMPMKSCEEHSGLAMDARSSRRIVEGSRPGDVEGQFQGILETVG